MCSGSIMSCVRCSLMFPSMSMVGGWAAGGLRLLRRALSSNSKLGCRMLMRKASATWKMVKGQPLAIMRSRHPTGSDQQYYNSDSIQPMVQQTTSGFPVIIEGMFPGEIMTIQVSKVCMHFIFLLFSNTH